MLNFMSLNYSQKVYGLILGFHALSILVLSTFTFSYLTGPLVFAYFCFSLLFVATTLYSTHTLLRRKTGVFAYLLNLMFLLGFWFKFSVQKITGAPYREPIGRFVFTLENEANVLWVVFCGICGFFLALVIFQKVFNKNDSLNLPNEKESEDSKLWLVILLLGALVLALVNLKYNILLFGYKPSVQLPLKGNAIFFLILTRFIPFFFFYFCFRRYSNLMLVGAGFLALICSCGVLSRMVVLGIFLVFFIYVLQNSMQWNFKRLIKQSTYLLFFFLVFSYLTVLIASGLRDFTATEQVYMTVAPSTSSSSLDIHVEKIKNKRVVSSVDKPIQSLHYFNFKEKLLHYKELALGRWIGIEGVMAVYAFPEKRMSLLWDGICEKSYSGYSFYSKFSNPEKTPDAENFKMISTSVPGPIAFFYYSGSLTFLCLAVFISTFFCLWIERGMYNFFVVSSSACIFVSTFMVFDFFQFGISPLAFLRYWGFSFGCLFLFYGLIRFKGKKIHA